MWVFPCLGWNHLCAKQGFSLSCSLSRTQPTSTSRGVCQQLVNGTASPKGNACVWHSLPSCKKGAACSSRIEYPICHPGHAGGGEGAFGMWIFRWELGSVDYRTGCRAAWSIKAPRPVMKGLSAQGWEPPGCWGQQSTPRPSWPSLMIIREPYKGRGHSSPLEIDPSWWWAENWENPNIWGGGGIFLKCFMKRMRKKPL